MPEAPKELVNAGKHQSTCTETLPFRDCIPLIEMLGPPGLVRVPPALL